MSLSFVRWLKSLKADLFGPSARPVGSVRLGMEPLEDRSVPATHTWIGPAGGLWSVGANWTGGAPTTGEAGGTIVTFNGGTTSTDDIERLVVDQINFTTGVNTITLTTQLGISGAVLGTNIQNTIGNNTINGAPLDITGDTAVLRVDSGTLTIASQIAGDAGIRKTGAATLELTTTTPSAYTGTTTVAEGVLLLNTSTENDTGLGQSTVIEVGDGIGGAGSAVLRLTGFFQIQDTASVTINPDGLVDVLGTGREDVSALTLNGGQLALEAGGLLFFQPHGTVTVNSLGGGESQITGAGGFALLDTTVTFEIAGTASDRFNMIGTIDLDQTQLIVNVINGDIPAGTIFTLINNDGTDAVTGTFAGLPQGATVTSGGRAFTISYTGGTGNDVTLTAQALPLAPAPTPAPFYSGAVTVGDLLVLQGRGVQGGAAVIPLPPGSMAFFADVSGDGKGDVILILGGNIFVFNGDTGAFFLAFFDQNGDGVKELVRF